MAQVQSFDAMDAQLKAIIGQLQEARDLIRLAERTEAKLYQNYTHPTTIDNQVQSLLDSAQAIIDAVQGASGDGTLADINTQHPIRVRINQPGSFENCDFDAGQVAAEDSGGTPTGTPFSVFQQNDVIEILSADLSANRILFTQTAAGTPTHTLTDSSNPFTNDDDDEQFECILRERT